MAHKIIVDKVLEAQKQKLANGTIEFADKYPGDVFLKDFSDTSCQVGIDSVNLDSSVTGAKQMSTTTSIASPEVLAAKDVSVLDIIEHHLMELKGNYFNIDMLDDLVIAIQEYLQDERANKSALALIADNAKLRGVFKLAQQIRNSDAFLALVAENTPVELPIPTKPPVQVVATGTTGDRLGSESQAKASNSKPKKGSKSPKTPKSKSVRPMPTIASLDELEGMDRKALVAAMGALNDNHVTGVRANGTTLDIKVALAKHILGVTYVAPVKPAKAPKAPKSSSKKPLVEAIIDLPEGLSWQEVLGMKYRTLQQLGKAFRSQGYQMPRLNSKGDDIRSAIKEAMRTMGYDIAETTLTAAPKVELNLPNWTEVKKQRKLEKIASEALKMNATDAQAHMQMAVAA